MKSPSGADLAPHAGWSAASAAAVSLAARVQPSPSPPADVLPDGALLLDGAALVLDDTHLILS